MAHVWVKPRRKTRGQHVGQRTSREESGKMDEIRRRFSTMSAQQRAGLLPEGVKMAGPMQAGDPLHFLNFGLACATTAFATAGVFYPTWFTGYKYQFAMKQDSAVLRVDQGLLGIKGCTEVSKNDELVICHGEAEKYTDQMNVFVTVTSLTMAVKIVGLIGMGFAALNVLLQIISFAMKHTSLVLHNSCIGISFLTAISLMISGMWANHYVVYGRQDRKPNGQLLIVQSLGPGMMLFAVVLAAVNGIFLHVVSHGPGPLSTNTRFLYQQSANEPEVRESMTTAAAHAAAVLSEQPPEDDSCEESTCV